MTKNEITNLKKAVWLGLTSPKTEDFLKGQIAWDILSTQRQNPQNKRQDAPESFFQRKR